VVIVIVTTAVLAGILVATLSSLDIGGFIRRMFGTVWEFIGVIIDFVLTVFQYILIPFEWLASMLLLFIGFIIRLFKSDNVNQGAGEGGSAVEEIEELARNNPPQDWLNIVKWLLFIIAVIVVTVIIARSIDKNRQRRRPDSEPDFEEERESLWSWRTLFRDIFRFFGNMWARFILRRKDKETMLHGWTATAHGEEPHTTLKIRDIFRHLLRDASRAGIAWQRSETAFEYARKFAEALPEAGQQMGKLTELYVSVRYSTDDAGETQVTHANVLWRHIRDSIRRPKKPG
jgi:hypothetical protein